MIRADLHMHTRFSADSSLSPRDLLEAAERSGLDAVAVTDHNTVRGGKETRKLARDSGINMIVMVGEEIDTGEGEIIGLPLRRSIRKGLGLERTCREIRKQGGLVMVPHMFDSLRKGIGKRGWKIVGMIDAVETFNARSLFSIFNKRNEDFASESGKSVFAGSDAHFREEVGAAFTLLDCSRSEKDILKALREGRTSVQGRKTGIRPHIRTFFQRFRQNQRDLV